MSSLAEYKSYLPDYLMQYHNVTNLKRFFHCLNPEHIDNNPVNKIYIQLNYS